MSAALQQPDPEIIWAPQAGPQKAYFDCPIPEILFGGSRGGGKSDGILGKWAAKSERYGAGFNAVFFRQEMPQQDDLTERGKEIFLPLGAEWIEYKKTFQFEGGGRLRFRPLESVADANKYQGQNLSDAAVEEAGNYPSSQPIDMLHGAMRSIRGVPVQLTLTANPGGAGHQWIKRRYIDPAPRGMKTLRRPLGDGSEHSYIYIPSRVQDNKALLARDPGYISRLHLVGSEALVKAWLTGDWNVVAGAFFDCWEGEKHVIRPFEIPEHWVRFGSFDWGSARPFAMQWWAISDGSLLPDGRHYPTGAMILYREWYGASGPNEGLRMTTADIARGIREREAGEKIDYRVADPACWKVDGGPSHAETMLREGVVFRKADNSRVPGWTQMRDRMIGQDGAPMLFAFSTVVDFIRTVPALQHDTVRPEDVDCWVAGTRISTPAGDRKIEDIRPGDVVDTPIGPRPVLRSYLSGSSETVCVALRDGRWLEGTPDHKVAVKGVGLIALKDLDCYMVLTERTKWQSALNIVVSSIRVMRDAYTTTRTVPSLLRAARASIGRFGWMPGDQFLLAGISTTGTATTITTNSPISNASRPEITDGTTWPSVSKVNLGVNSRNGVSQRADKQLFGKMRERWSSARLSANVRADIVACLSLLDTLRSTFARISAPRLFRTLRARFAGSPSAPSPTPPSASEPARISAVGRFAAKVPVYNLTVADAHLFYANGVLSSNTDGEDHDADACRYGVMSRPWTRKPSVVLPMRGVGQMTFAEALKHGSPQRAGGRI